MGKTVDAMTIPPNFHRCDGRPTIAADGFPSQQIECPHQGYCLRYLERGNGVVQEPRREGGKCFDFVTEEGIKMMVSHPPLSNKE